MDQRLSGLTLRHLAAIALALLGAYWAADAVLLLFFGPFWLGFLLSAVPAMVVWAFSYWLWPKLWGR